MHTVNVTEVKHYSDRLFSFKTTRPNTLRFRNGEFVMIGLPDVVKEITNKPIMRAYSIVSTNYDEHLEFLSIKVPNGPLTEKLQNVQIDIPYVSASGKTETLSFVCSLQYTVDNGTASESSANIKVNAPTSFYTQNRMITGEDYNVAPLATNQEIIKVLL